MATATSSALAISATTFSALDTEMSTIAGNLALSRVNASNPFITDFQISAVENVQTAGTYSPDAGSYNPLGTSMVKGIQLAGLYMLVQQGTQDQTGYPLDIMINGPGYAVVNTPNGKMYTRDLRLQRGQTLKKGPYDIDPAIVIPPDATELKLSPDGTWSAMLPGQETPTILGQMTIALFNNPQALKPMKDNLYASTGANGSGDPITGIAGTQGYGEFIQGALEHSTINPTDELIRLVNVSKLYGYVTKVVEREDEKEKQLVRAV